MKALALTAAILLGISGMALAQGGGGSGGGSSGGGSSGSARQFRCRNGSLKLKRAHRQQYGQLSQYAGWHTRAGYRNPAQQRPLPKFARTRRPARRFHDRTESRRERQPRRRNRSEWPTYRLSRVGSGVA